MDLLKEAVMTYERETAVCFTGHRHLPPRGERAIRDRTEDAMRELIRRGFDTFLVGGALGFDTLAQLTAIRLRAELPYLRVLMVIPCEGQDARWSEKDRSMYRNLLRLADERIVLRGAYTPSCMHERNRYMIDHSAACIACWDGRTGGGTAATVRYAAARGVPVRNVYGEE